MYRDHRKGPGGPPAPRGHMGCRGCALAYKGQGHQPQEAHAPREQERKSPKGGRHLLGALGGMDSSLGRTLPWRKGQGCAPPGGLYTGGREGSTQQPWAPPSSPATPLSLSQKLGKALPRPATSTTTPSCCWISINLSSPLARSRRRRRRCSVRVLNAEVPSVRHSVIGDLDHGEYDSVIHVHWNASARDLQGYVDALLSPRC